MLGKVLFGFFWGYSFFFLAKETGGSELNVRNQKEKRPNQKRWFSVRYAVCILLKWTVCG